jgi:hypothetical protein
VLGHRGQVGERAHLLDVDADRVVVHGQPDEVAGVGEGELRPAGQGGLAVLGAAPAGAVEGQLRGGGPGGLGQHEPAEGVRGQVAGPVRGPPEAVQPLALGRVEQADQGRRGGRVDRRGPPHDARTGHSAIVTQCWSDPAVAGAGGGRRGDRRRGGAAARGRGTAAPPGACRTGHAPGVNPCGAPG